MKKIAKHINEYTGGVGAGYSYGGGSSIFPVNRGGQMNRGGFGGASNLGGPNMMYTYEIKPLNRTLQPKETGVSEVEEIRVGNTIKGQELNKRDGKIYVGKLMQIVKTNNGAIKYYVILDKDTATKKKLDPTAATLVTQLYQVNPLDFLPNYSKPERKIKKLIPESLQEYQLYERNMRNNENS